jgi:ubiquinol-cytochrome c reductase iron-sulfur subunit
MTRIERLAAAAFVVAAFAAGGFVASYWTGGRHTQLQGLLLAIAFAAIGAALVVWANRLLPGGDHTEERTPLRATPDEIAEVNEELDRSDLVARRVWLRRGAILAGGAVGAAVVSPARSFGPSPGHALLSTPWRGGARVVTQTGEPVTADRVPVDALLTVFPEHAVDAADAQAVLVRVDPQLLHPSASRRDWAPDGLLAFSKVCTHAGCPVGLYEARSHQLLCPCHQSSFDVLRRATPISGPAAWPLPQLPLAIGSDGVLHSTGDFSAPVGPGWWYQ